VADDTTAPTNNRGWYLGAMNDGLFIIDVPPRPSTDDLHHEPADYDRIPRFTLNCNGMRREQAEAIVAAHNTVVSEMSQPALEKRLAAIREPARG